MPKEPREAQFNADEKTEELLSAPITIGAKVFHPARLTPDVSRDDLAISIRTSKIAREAKLSAQSAEDLTEAELDERPEVIAQINRNSLERIAVLIRDEQGQPPTVEFLEEHLDTRIASKLLDWLRPDQDEEDAEDEKPGEAPPTPPTGS